MRQNSKRGVVSHGAETLTSTDDHGREEHVHRLRCVAEHIEASGRVFQVETGHLGGGGGGTTGFARGLESFSPS